MGGLGALGGPHWGTGTLRVTPRVMQGGLLAVKQLGRGHREGTQGEDTRWGHSSVTPQGVGALRLSLSRIQIRPHWKNPWKRCLILPKKFLILDFQIRPNWENKEQGQTLGGERGPGGPPAAGGTRRHPGPSSPQPAPSRRRAPPWAAAPPGKRSPGTRSPPVGHRGDTGEPNHLVPQFPHRMDNPQLPRDEASPRASGSCSCWWPFPVSGTWFPPG